MGSRLAVRIALGVGTALLIVSMVSIVETAADSGAAARTSEPQAVERPDWTPMLPPGPGREYVVGLCNGCHSVARLALQKKSAARWRGFLLAMNTAATTSGELCACTGGGLDDEEIEILTAYLSQAFGPSNPIDQLPLNLNTATAAAMARLPGLESRDVQKLIASRARAPFRNRREIEQLLGTGKFRRIGAFVDVKDSLFRVEAVLPM
jgi:hypothetical protein